ncbi:MAG: polysaccharide biosynthesis C-terminal domain-containing protein [Lachnospiraceae bacterium]|nr:polysaccharide biosynthesis C-terminal domain-containing protein [Lachnospiraceae bacterium]
MTGSSDKKTNVLASFIEFFYGNFVVLLLGFISLPLITRLLSTDEYGRTSLFLSAVSIIYIFAILGLDQSYIRYFYSEKVDTRKLFSTCLRAPLILICILSAVYFAFSHFFNNILFERDGLDVTLLVIAYTVTSVFERFLFLNIRMEQKGKLYSNLNILTKVLNITFIVVFALILGDDFRVGLYEMTLPLVIVTVFLLIRFAVQGKGYTAAPHELSEKELLRYGIPFVPMLLMEWLLSSMDKWSIRFLNDFSETGVYSSAMQIMSILLTLKITYVAFWSPIAMKKYEQEDESVAKPFFADMFQKVQFLCMFAAFGITAFRSIIVLILGSKYRGAVKIIPFLALMPVLSILFEMTGQGIKFTKKPKYFNYASLVAIICNLAGNLFLVPRLCGVGAAIATAFTYLVYFAIGTYFAGRCYPVEYDHRRFAVSVIFYIAYAAFATFTDNEWMNVAIGVILIVGLFILNRRVVAALWGYLTDTVRSFMKKEK